MMNLSFSGCGFLGIYHLGVATCFKTFAPHVLKTKALYPQVQQTLISPFQISGSSAGSCVALALVLDSDLADIASDLLAGSKLARAGLLATFPPSFNSQEWIRENLERNLPENAYQLVSNSVSVQFSLWRRDPQVSGRLHVSLTRVCDGRNVILNTFHSNQELIEAILGSCFIPCFSGLVTPTCGGVRVVDGGYTSNVPVLDQNTITVSPLSGDADICPQHNLLTSLTLNFGSSKLEVSGQNLLSLIHILLPPSEEVLSAYCRQGFQDTLRFLQSRHLVSVPVCPGMSSSLFVGEFSPISGYNVLWITV